MTHLKISLIRYMEFFRDLISFWGNKRRNEIYAGYAACIRDELKDHMEEIGGDGERLLRDDREIGKSGDQKKVPIKNRTPRGAPKSKRHAKKALPRKKKNK